MQFRIGNIPVRVRASFFVMALILASGGPSDPAIAAVWIAIVFASVLVHELGHAVAARAFGLSPSVELYAMGGLTSYAPRVRLSHGQQVVISLAGPLVGLAVAAALVAARAFGVLPRTPIVTSAFEAGLWVNGAWSVFNLLPMLPLDGGNVALHVLNGITGGRGERSARILSLVVATLVALAALSKQLVFVLILSVSFAVQNARMLGQLARAKRDEPLGPILERAAASLARGDARAAIVDAESVAGQAASGEVRLQALRLLAYAYVEDGRWSQLLGLLQSGLGQALPEEDLARFESAARASGSREAADAIVQLRSKGAKDEPNVQAFRAD